ncbi:MAG: TrkH family potassium uptake protein [Clostridia bacterium]|nr:TrkH family potassium uptake protein [Clostridia bacterium]
MNRRVILHTVGQIIKIEAALLVLPLLVSLYYGEASGVMAFAVTAAVALVIGFALTLTNKRGDRRIFARGGLVSVALSWIALSVIGALPFVISGEIPSYVDALFETVSGFTTTGASILSDPAMLSRGMLFWRSFTHWIGGMGVIVLMMAILPAESGRSIHIMRAEMPGPIVGKLVPRLRDTAKTLYLIYIVLSALQVVLLLFGGMPLFDSVVYTFGTAGTGGFGLTTSSVGAYSAYSQWVIAVFMLVFGINFNVYQLLLMRRFRTALRSSEMWCFLAIVAIASTAITVNLLPEYAYNVGEASRYAVFQVASIISTTGYATTNFDLWPGMSRTILMLLMLIGACAGSTAGGLKVSRVMLLFKSVKRDLQRVVHPRSVSSVSLEGKKVDDSTLSGVGAYFVLYILCIAAAFLFLSFEPTNIETDLTATIACFNNVGPGLGEVGPAGSYGGYSILSKLVLSLAMLLGRLEIYPLLVVLSPSTWQTKKH